MSTQPTDVEIDALWRFEASKNWDSALAMRTSFTRAVLAKWGTPVPVGVEPLIPFKHGCKWCGKTTGCKHTPTGVEPVAWAFKYDDGTWHDPSTTEHSSGMRPLFAAPQTVEREPLSDDEVDSLCKVGPVYAPDGKVTRTPQQYRDELEAAQRYGLRKGERAHGIKGDRSVT